MKLLGQELAASEKINQLIESLVKEVEARSAQIRDVKPPQEGSMKQSAELIAQINKDRGRPLFYDFVGSGAGRGVYVELEDGSVKLDMINGIGIHLMGHSHPRVMAAAVRGAIQDIVMQGNLEPNKEYAKFSRKLIDVASRKSRLKHAWLATCGTIANENALKICRQKKTPARKIIAMNNAFAGRSTLMAEVTDNPAFKEGLPNYNEVLRIPFYDKKDPRSSEKSLELFKKHLDENKNDICAFTFEPMQGEGGYRVAPREFFVPMLELCKQNKIPVWFDEVQTFTRTGEFFAFETLGLGEYVDVCTIAKTAQNGATLYTEEYNPNPGLIAGTFSGSSPSLSAGLEIMEMLDNEGFLGPNGKVAKIHTEFMSMLHRLGETTLKGKLYDPEGLGLMIGVTALDGSKEKQLALLKVLFKNGLMSFGCGRGPYRVRFLIPAITTTEDIQRVGQILEKSILELS